MVLSRRAILYIESLESKKSRETDDQWCELSLSVIVLDLSIARRLIKQKFLREKSRKRRLILLMQTEQKRGIERERQRRRTKKKRFSFWDDACGYVGKATACLKRDADRFSQKEKKKKKREKKPSNGIKWINLHVRVIYFEIDRSKMRRSRSALSRFNTMATQRTLFMSITNYIFECSVLLDHW